jgi:hypothetical protein
MTLSRAHQRSAWSVSLREHALNLAQGGNSLRAMRTLALADALHAEIGGDAFSRALELRESK